ncbi:MAG: virulence RhuM family protein, partial [Prevotellaceae bacterium]|nr:virulence RhuM family protein [Prevotellaceae bacterium]
RNFRITTQHGAIMGKTQESIINLYNLDVIISVGYRVKSLRKYTEIKSFPTLITTKYNRLQPFTTKQ